MLTRRGLLHCFEGLLALPFLGRRDAAEVPAPAPAPPVPPWPLALIGPLVAAYTAHRESGLGTREFAEAVQAVLRPAWRDRCRAIGMPLVDVLAGDTAWAQGRPVTADFLATPCHVAGARPERIITPRRSLDVDGFGPGDGHGWVVDAAREFAGHIAMDFGSMAEALATGGFVAAEDIDFFGQRECYMLTHYLYATVYRAAP